MGAGIVRSVFLLFSDTTIPCQGYGESGRKYIKTDDADSRNYTKSENTEHKNQTLVGDNTSKGTFLDARKHIWQKECWPAGGIPV